MTDKKNNALISKAQNGLTVQSTSLASRGLIAIQNNEKLIESKSLEARRERLKEMIKLGKERGYLTFGEINVHLPEMLEVEQIEGLVSMIEDMGINVCDTPQPRWLRFPEDVSVGTVWLNEGDLFFDKNTSWTETKIGEEHAARGEIEVPPGWFSCLCISEEINDLSFLRHIDSHALHGLEFNSHATDADLAHLKALTNLTFLGLSGCKQITDAGLAHLASLTNLTYLLFGCDQTTDAGLAHLKSLTNLTFLDLSVCKQITDAAINIFQRSLPNCEIRR